MFVIFSEIDPEAANQVSRLWYALRKSCGLKAIYNVPRPHVTWFAADQINSSNVEQILIIMAEQTKALSLRTFGFGIFSGENPVLYLPIVKTKAMFNIHQQLWDQLCQQCNGHQSYYEPSKWVPHITLALKDLNKNNLTCAVNAIAFKPLELLIHIDAIALATYQNEPPGKILARFDFNNGGSEF